MLFQHIILNLRISRFCLRTCCIQFIQVQINLNPITRFLLGQKNNRLHVARLLQIDVKYVAKFAFVRGNLSKRVFCRKTHRFLPLYVLGNRSKTLLLPIICKSTYSPTASRPRTEETSLKSHRLNSNNAYVIAALLPSSHLPHFGLYPAVPYCRRSLV